LNDAEDWLYSDEGEDATKSVYKERLDILKKMGDPIAHRYLQAELLPSAIRKFNEAVSTYLTQATSGDEKLAHISAEDLSKVKEEADKKQQWLEEKLSTTQRRDKTEDPVVTATEVDHEREVSSRGRSRGRIILSPQRKGLILTLRFVHSTCLPLPYQFSPSRSRHPNRHRRRRRRPRKRRRAKNQRTGMRRLLNPRRRARRRTWIWRLIKLCFLEGAIWFVNWLKNNRSVFFAS